MNTYFLQLLMCILELKLRISIKSELTQELKLPKTQNNDLAQKVEQTTTQSAQQIQDLTIQNSALAQQLEQTTTQSAQRIQALTNQNSALAQKLEQTTTQSAQRIQDLTNQNTMLIQELELTKIQKNEQIQEIKRIRKKNNGLAQKLERITNELNEAQQNYTGISICLNNVGHIFNVHPFPYIDAYNFSGINYQPFQFNQDEHSEPSSPATNSQIIPNNPSMSVTQ